MNTQHLLNTCGMFLSVNCNACHVGKGMNVMCCGVIVCM